MLQISQQSRNKVCSGVFFSALKTSIWVVVTVQWVVFRKCYSNMVHLWWTIFSALVSGWDGPKINHSALVHHNIAPQCIL